MIHEMQLVFVSLLRLVSVCLPLITLLRNKRPGLLPSKVSGFGREGSVKFLLPIDCHCLVVMTL